MKKYLLLIIFSAITVSSLVAQTQLPNGDFEIWIIIGGMPEEPQNWGTPNQRALGPEFTAVAIKTADAMSGDALKLENKFAPITSDTIPGVAILNGDFYSMDQPKGGMAFTDRPDSLVG